MARNWTGGNRDKGRRGGYGVLPLERRTLLSASFAAPVQYTVGTLPTAVAVADLGNGHPDIVVVNGDTGTASVLLGNGNGTFGAATTYNVGANPFGLAVADLGNGHLDLVVTNALASGTVSVLLGNGDGTFGAATTFPVGTDPQGVAVADVNGDGHPDLVVANEVDGTLSILLGHGDGTFAAQTTLTTGTNPNSVAIADLGNGHPDLVYDNGGDGTIGVRLGNGTGTFGAQQTVTVGQDPDALAVADLTGDGHPDIVVANGGSSTVTLLPGDGSGTFGGINEQFTTGADPHSLAVGDVDGDGNLDVVVGLGLTDQVAVLYGTGSDSLDGPDTFATGGVPYGIAVADLNGDGLADVVAADTVVSTAGAHGTSVSVLLNTTGSSSPTPTPTSTKELVFASAPVTAAAAATLPPVVVAVASLTGQQLTTDDSQVTLSVSSGPDGGTLAGVTTVAAVDGLATFSGLSVAIPGTYVLAATATGAASTASPAIAVAPASAAPTLTVGGLNPAFGKGGLASHDVGFTSTNGVAADGAQSVLVGPIGTAPNQAFGVTRYNADGSLDTTFGTNGVTATPFAGGSAVPTAVVVLPDGQILVAGTVTAYAGGVATSSTFAVARYDPDGSLDTTFGTGGTAVVAFGATPSNDVLRALVLGPNGRVYLGGSTDEAGKGNTDFAVAALTSAGALDPTFGTGGKAVVDVAGGDDSVNALLVQKNGELVAAGSAVVGTATDVALVRFTTAGVADKHFGTKGVETVSVGGVYDAATTLTQTATGLLVVGGVTASGSGASLSSSFLVQRYTANGKPDKSFGKAGSAVTPFGQPAAVTQVVVLADGSVIASGRTGATFATATDVAVARYTTRGALDTAFNDTGTVVINLGSGVVASPAAEVFAAAAAVDLGAAFDAFTASEQGVVAVTPGGQILVAGNSGADTVEAEVVALGVDLIAKLLASSVPAAAVGGLKGTATITVTDAGPDKAIGPLAIVIQFSTSAGGTAAVTAKTAAERSNLLEGTTRTYRVAFNYPTGLAAAGYYMVVTAAGGTGLGAELHPANNVAVSASAVTITPAVIKLSGSALAAVGSVTVGKPAHVSITLANAGNVTAAGKIAVDLYLSTTGTLAGATQLTVPPVAISIAAGKSKTVRLTATLPAAVTAGSYTLLAVVDPAHGLGSIDQTDVSALVVDASPVVVG